jgi:acyl carrier protein
MTHQEIKKEVELIFKEVLDNPHIVLEDSTTSKDVDDWDSLNHIQLIVSIEKKFHLRFTSSEINGWKNVGEMCSAIETKIKP